MRSVLEEIKNQANINFIYKDNLVDNLKVTCRVEGTPGRVIKKLLSKYDISCKVFGKNSFVLFKEEKPGENLYKTVIVEQKMPVTDTTRIITGPKIILRTEPFYPLQAVKNEIEGNVTVSLYVTKEGNVSKAVVSSSSGFAILDSAAINYSYNLKFSPAKDNGEPKSTWVSMIYKYFFVNK